MQKITENTVADQQDEEIKLLQDQVATLEELLSIYEQSATEREGRLQEILRKSEEKALQLAHAQSALQTVKAILDSMGDAVVVTDSKGHTLFSNPAAAKLLEAEFLEHSLSYLSPSLEQVPDENASSKERSLKEVVLEKSIDDLEVYVEEHSCWLSVNARPLEAEGQTTGAVTVFRNVTQIRQVAQALQQSNEEFRQQSQVLANTLQELKQAQATLIHEEKMTSLGQTVAGIAHEINNPVTFIHGNIEIAEQAFQELLNIIRLFQQTYPDSTPAIDEAIHLIDLDFLAEDLPRMMSSMTVGTGRIREIVKSLRVFSRLDEAAVKAVDIHEGIDSACLIVQSQLAASADRDAITIRKNYGKLPLLECHASQLNQVFVHLLSNAIHAFDASDSRLSSSVTRASSPEIVIHTEALADKIVVQISDNGIGISESIRPKIFDPFFTTRPIGQGTGLGLSVCYQIVVGIHHGSINCTSQEGIGTEFEISLPINGSAG